MSRTCLDCSAAVSAKAARCRPCSTRRINADPELAARRDAATRARNADPGVKAATAARLAAYMATMPEAHREQRREQGRRAARLLHSPEVRARNQSQATRARAGVSITATKLCWCPPPLRGRYRELTRTKHFTAAEARAIIEAEIPGTVPHARRAIANIELRQQLRAERERAEAY